MFYKRYLFLFLLVLESFGSTELLAQDNSVAIAAADTSGFSINSGDGWRLFNSYVTAYKADSVDLEIILQHVNNINWSEEHYVGRIKAPALIPENEQMMTYSLVVTLYSLRIDKEGKCYLKLISGQYPRQNPTVIPLKIIFKK